MKVRGLGGVYQRGDIWWIHYSIGGHQRFESSESTKKKAATDLLKERTGQIARGELLSTSARRVRFDDLSQKLEADYVQNRRRNLRGIKRCIARLEESFAGWRAMAITTEEIERYRDARLTEGAAPATVNGELAALKRMFNLAVRARLLATKPYIPMLHVENARQGFFEHERLERVLVELPDYLRPLAEAAYATGWRRGELLSLTWAQVDFEAETFRLEPGTTKNGRGRTFPWGRFPRLRAVVLEQRDETRRAAARAGRIIAHVFHRDGRPILDFYTAWREACRRAECPGMLFHDLRRTAVRNLERAGVPRSVAMQLTGHLTESIYRRYDIVDEADLSAGVERLAVLDTARTARRAVMES